MSPAPRSQRHPRLALLGDGSMAGQHAAVLAELGCPVHVVFGPKPDQVRGFADRHHIERWTTSLDEVIGDAQVDAVIIASPNDQHANQASAAATGGKHVLCEVPLATSLPDAAAVVDSAGLVKVLIRADGAPKPPVAAPMKAAAAAAFDQPGSQMEPRSKTDPAFAAQLLAHKDIYNDHPGSLPLHRDGKLIGGLAVADVPHEMADTCARAAVAAAWTGN